ncbi:unnamed protein product [Anisakis simplex]|uniref:4-nitrophenylphosphatase n=1 Tax=Anisakis simplex TaxID=6269 RepID=A0A0M3K045_ANISI|nr:unnamed protein product [Anisakis simplex]
MSTVKRVVGRELLERFDAVLFDGDGVLWLGGKPISAAIGFVRNLVNKGCKKVFIITNNSTKTLSEHAAKCKNLGYDMIDPEHIISPAKVVSYLLAKNKSDLPVYLIGSAGLQAINYIQQPGVQFIATNEDATFPGPNPNVRIPGAGTNVMAVKFAAGKAPLVIGKPARPIFDYIREKYGVNPAKTLMIGDRCDTDIKFGRDHGMCTMLVGTGISSMDDVRQYEKQKQFDLVPDYFSDSFADLLDDC